jgi:hypothetical protein
VSVSQVEALERPVELLWVRVANLAVGSSFREGGLCAEQVERLVTLGGVWPPILVRRDGLVVDGAHRVAAARRLGLARLEAQLFDGGPEEAFIEFVRRNVAHGLLLTLRERKRAAVRVLRTHREWSDRRVAELCGISSKTVARLRLEAGICPTAESPQLDVRVGRDEKVRPVQRGSVRGRVLEALQAQPNGSLRAVAAVAGVSPETVRLLRMNLARVPQPTEQEPQREEPAVSWREDVAMTSCDAGEEFLAWFERTQVTETDLARVSAVPLSRVYELADEARRRSAIWHQLGRALESRTARPAD